MIASGVAADIRSTEVGSNSESDVLLTNSNYDKIEEGGGGNVTNVGSSSSNQTALPVFADFGLFHQAITARRRSTRGPTAASARATSTAAHERSARRWTSGPTSSTPRPPDTAFDRTPKRKTRKHKAIFRFHASEPVDVHLHRRRQAGAAVRLAVQGEVQEARQAHGQVVATDAVGNVDPTPASYTWKIKKKKKKKRRHGQR